RHTRLGSDWSSDVCSSDRFATAGTPAPVIARLNQIANTALRDPAVAQKLEVQGIVPRPMSPAEFATFVDGEIKKFGEIMTRANRSEERRVGKEGRTRWERD